MTHEKNRPILTKEINILTSNYVVPYNVDVLISVGTIVFVVETDDVSQFVYHNIFIFTSITH